MRAASKNAACVFPAIANPSASKPVNSHWTWSASIFSITASSRRGEPKAVRLFVALEIPSDVRDNLAAFLKDMRKLSEELPEKGVRWVRPENLHMTLKFIGEVADAKLEGIRAALATVRGAAPIEIQIRGMGFFPDGERPTVLWTGLDAAANLASLAGAMDRATATQGIKKENRAFLPHLTL